MTAQAVFETLRTLSLMLLFSLSVEWLVANVLLRRVRLRLNVYVVLALVGVGVLLYTSLRLRQPVALTAGDLLTVLGNTSLLAGVAVWFAVIFFSQRIPLPALLSTAAAFAVTALFSAFLLKGLSPELPAGDAAFAGIALGLALAVPLSILLPRWMERLLSGTKAQDWQPKEETLLFDEKRRERLEKRRSRRS